MKKTELSKLIVKHSKLLSKIYWAKKTVWIRSVPTLCGDPDLPNRIAIQVQSTDPRDGSYRIGCMGKQTERRVRLATACYAAFEYEHCRPSLYVLNGCVVTPPGFVQV
jgi:hypothetical protein